MTFDFADDWISSVRSLELVDEYLEFREIFFPFDSPQDIFLFDSDVYFGEVLFSLHWLTFILVNVNPPHYI